MPTQIYSKKTNAELIALTAEVTSNKGQYDERVTAVDASLGEIIAEIAGNKAEYDARVSAVDASLSSIVAEAEANRLQAVSDLKDTVNSVLTEEFVKTTLDSFLAKDAELSAAVNAAVADRVNVDTEIKAKFDLLVAKLFEGLTFEGVTQTELSFGAPPLTSGIKLPDGTFVASVDDIVLSEWRMNANKGVQVITQVVQKGSHIVWIYTPDNWNFYIVVTDESTGATTDAGYNSPADMGNHTTPEAIRDLWIYTGLETQIKHNANYTLQNA